MINTSEIFLVQLILQEKYLPFFSQNKHTSFKPEGYEIQIFDILGTVEASIHPIEVSHRMT
jgi:hypothetical protein